MGKAALMPTASEGVSGGYTDTGGRPAPGGPKKKMMRRTLLSLAVSCVIAVPAAAQQLTMTFNNGLVTVDAASVPVRTILNEWAKRGGTKIVGGDRVSGAPLTVKLIDVPESQALEVLLRSVAGYMAAPRSTGEGASIYDRILVMATSSTPAPAAASRPPANPNAMPGTQRFVPPQRQPAEDEDREEDDPNPPNPPVFTFPGAPGQNGQPGAFISQPQGGGGNGQPMQPMIVNPQGGQTIYPTVPPGYLAPAPFGSSTPGTITQPVVQPNPTTTVRPPGRQQQ